MPQNLFSRHLPRYFYTIERLEYSYQSVCHFVGIGFPTPPPPQASVSPPLDTTLACGWGGWGRGTNSDDWTDSLALCITHNIKQSWASIIFPVTDNRYLAPWTKELKDTKPLMSSLLVICLGWCSNFVGSESGQKQSVKLLQNMVYSTIQIPPLPPSHTNCLYILYSTFSLAVWKGGKGGGQREGRGATVHNTKYLYI
jgi:hypothetical protein